MFPGLGLYDLYDLYDLAHVAGWELCNLHDLAHDRSHLSVQRLEPTVVGYTGRFA